MSAISPPLLCFAIDQDLRANVLDDILSQAGLSETAASNFRRAVSSLQEVSGSAHPWY